MDKAPSDHITPWSEHLRSVTAERLGATKSNSGVSDQQCGFESPAVFGPSLSNTICLLLQPSDGT